MAKRSRTIKNPVQKGRITIREAREAARSAKAQREGRAAVTGKYAKRSAKKG